MNRLDVPHVTYAKVWSLAPKRPTPPMPFGIQRPYNVLNPVNPAISFNYQNEDKPIYNTYQEWKKLCVLCRRHRVPRLSYDDWQCHRSWYTESQHETVCHTRYYSHFRDRLVYLPSKSRAYLGRHATQHRCWTFLTVGSSPFNEKQLVVRLINDSGKTLIKDIVHPIGQHRTPDLTGPSIGVGNQHSFESTLNLSSRIRDTYGKLQIVYRNGSEEEVLHSLRVEIR